MPPSRQHHVAKTDRYEIHLADSRDVLDQMPSRSVDLILTDPPYNLGLYSRGNISLSWRKEINNDLAAWDTVTFDPAHWADDFLRILKPTGNLFAFTSYNLLGRWHQVFDPLFDTFQFMVWHKTNPVPKVRKAGFVNSCELIVCMWQKGHTWNFTRQKEMHNFIETPICMGKERTRNPVHPTQKPLKVLEHVVDLASHPGDMVFDPFMGVGSTGVAAMNRNRRFWGAENEASYFRAAEQRLRTASEPGESA